MDLRSLRYFLACVDERSFHSAAKAVRISQPALSRAVQNLEEELGVVLLDRNPRGVTPTAYGLVLVRYARMLESEVRRAKAEIESLRGSRSGQISVGVGPMLAEFLLAPALSRLAHEGQAPRASVRVGFSHDLLPGVLDGSLDFALSILPETPLPEITFEPLARYRLCIAARRDHPLARQASASLNDLGRFPWIFPSAPREHRDHLSNMFINAGLAPPLPFVEVTTPLALKSLITTTDSLTILSDRVLSLHASELGELPIDLGFPERVFGLVYRSHVARLPGAKLLMETLRQEARGSTATDGGPDGASG